MTAASRFSRWGIPLMWLVVCCYAVIILVIHTSRYEAAANSQQALYTEFTPTYGASMLLREQPAEQLFQRQPMESFTQKAARLMYPGSSEFWVMKVGWAAWLYPPSFALLVLPLAFFPYWIAHVLWVGVTAVPYLAAMRTILPARLAWPYALAAPPSYYNALMGQTGFLVAGLIALGLSNLRSRPVLGGIAIGLASIKPHFGLLIPIALVAGGYWRVIASATITVLATVMVSALVLGVVPWEAFVEAMLNQGEAVKGAYRLKPMTSVFAFFLVLEVPLEKAFLIQQFFTTAMAGLVAMVWWRGQHRPDTLGLQAAVLCLATLLAVHKVYIYDLALMVPASAWVWLYLTERQAPRWQFAWVVFSLAGVLGILTLASFVKVQIGPLFPLMLLGLTLYRFQLAMKSPSPPLP